MLNQTETPQSIQAYRRLMIGGTLYALALSLLALVIPEGIGTWW